MIARAHSSGVTLVELVIVMLLTAILGAMVALFARPIFQYSDTRRRAEMTDIADTALRRMGRDLRNALPNSVRVTTVGSGATAQYHVEMLLLRSGGRYRADVGSSGGTACGADGSSDASMLVFAAADTCFKSIGNVLNYSSIAATDYVAIYNLSPGTTNADAYAGGNLAQLSAAPAQETGQVRFPIGSHTFTYESPAQRFQVIEGPVSYVCDKGAQTLTRYSGYGISSAQPTVGGSPALPGTGSSALVANQVADCSFSYDANVVAQSAGLVTMFLKVATQDEKANTESVGLYQTVHVSNIP